MPWPNGVVALAGYLCRMRIQSGRIRGLGGDARDRRRASGYGATRAEHDQRHGRLRYPGGEQVIEVGPDARVVGLVEGDRTLLVPGAAVTIRATQAADGGLTALSVSAERNRVNPLP